MHIGAHYCNSAAHGPIPPSCTIHNPPSSFSPQGERFLTGDIGDIGDNPMFARVSCIFEPYRGMHLARLKKWVWINVYRVWHGVTVWKKAACPTTSASSSNAPLTTSFDTKSMRRTTAPAASRKSPSAPLRLSIEIGRASCRERV